MGGWASPGREFGNGKPLAIPGSTDNVGGFYPATDDSRTVDFKHGAIDPKQRYDLVHLVENDARNVRKPRQDIRLVARR